MKSAKRQFDPQAFLAKVGTGKSILKYRKGRIIYAQGEEADKVFYIQSGKVKVTVLSEQGKEAVVAILNPAQFFGEGSRVSFFLNEFRKLGLISYNAKIEVHRSLLNAVLYEKPQLERDEKPTE